MRNAPQGGGRGRHRRGRMPCRRRRRHRLWRSSTRR